MAVPHYKEQISIGILLSAIKVIFYNFNGFWVVTRAYLLVPFIGTGFFYLKGGDLVDSDINDIIINYKKIILLEELL